MVLKKSFFVSIAAVIMLVALQNCKPDKHTTITQGSDPDSLYVGTHYTLAKPTQFPNFNNHYTDSLTYEGIELGRRMFYDKRLSGTGQMSCNTCHKLQFSFSDTVATPINAINSSHRNAPPLVNLAWLTAYFWDGRSPTLAAQARFAFYAEIGASIPNDITLMKGDTTYVKLFKKAFGRPGDITEDKMYLAMQQFLMSAISGNSKFDRVVGRQQESFTPNEQFAWDSLFLTERGECYHCHSEGSDLLMMNNFNTGNNKYDNIGLDSVTNYTDYIDAGRGAITGQSYDYGKFRAPSLRNIAVSGPYMHDGRYRTLSQVIDFYSDSIRNTPNINGLMINSHYANGGAHFTNYEKQCLLEFLNTFTDTTFLNNPNLKSPF